MLALWKPLNGGFSGNLGNFDRELDRLWREGLPSVTRSEEPASLVPAADVSETEDALIVRLDLPGHDPSKIEVKIEDDVLSVTSERRALEEQKTESFYRTERRYGVFTRSFRLPTTVNGSRVEARYDNGVLTISLPKREESKPRTIQVKVASE